MFSYVIIGLCSLNLEPENTILACPDKIPGQVTIHLYGSFGVKGFEFFSFFLSNLFPIKTKKR